METLEDYTKTTFGELKIGDTFNIDIDAPNELDFYRRVKVGDSEAKYADGSPMSAPPENDWESHETVYIKS